MKMCLLPILFLPASRKIFSSLLRFVFFRRLKMKRPICCPNADCQRARRRLNQRLRRAKTRRKASTVKAGPQAVPGQIKPEAARKPHEAGLTQFHPVFIGLVAQLIDSTSPEDILTFLRRCATRGQDILSPPTLPVPNIATLGLSPKAILKPPASGNRNGSSQPHFQTGGFTTSSRRR